MLHHRPNMSGSPVTKARVREEWADSDDWVLLVCHCHSKRTWTGERKQLFLYVVGLAIRRLLMKMLVAERGDRGTGRWPAIPLGGTVQDMVDKRGR